MNIQHSFKNRIIALALMTSLALVFSKCKKDPLELHANSQQSAALTGNLKSTGLAADGITSGSYYLENSLPVGYVKDGSVDYTTFVQAAVTQYSNIVFPAFPILVNDKGIIIGSNKTITFLPGSQLILKETTRSTYNILKISDADNIVLYNPVIIGDRNLHLATDGEAGMGIGIRGSSNVTIYGPKISECWGDGIYIGQSGGTNNCSNIVIKDAYLRKNRRDGISIIAVDSLVLDNIYAGYSDGTEPMSGINFEPNNPACEFKNVLVNNVRTEYNGSNGIQIGVKNMLGTTDKTTDFRIVNHVDVGSPRYAFKLMCNPDAGTLGQMNGTVEIVNPTWNNTGTNIPLYACTSQLNFKTTVSSPEVMNTSGKLLSYEETNTLLLKQALSAPLSVNNINPAEVAAVVFAVNAGGTTYTASNGITYGPDKYYTKGSTYKVLNEINNTPDDVLYQSERYGNFSYAIPLSNGIYEITFRASETYHKVSGKRQFDILAENNAVVSNLDLYSAAGYSNAFDIVKTVTVSDGILNIAFNTDLDNAKVCAFHVIRK